MENVRTDQFRCAWQCIKLMFKNSREHEVLLLAKVHLKFLVGAGVPLTREARETGQFVIRDKRCPFL